MSEESAERLAREARQTARALAREAREAARQAAREAREEVRNAREEAKRAGGSSERRHANRPDGTRADATFGADVRRVSINHTAGRLTIRPCGPDEEPRIVSHGSKAAPELRVQQSGDHLTISVKLTMGRLFRRRQGADSEVWLPAELDELTVDQGAGRVDAEAITAKDLRLDIGAGDITMRRMTADMIIHVGAGKVAVTGHSGKADVDTGTGDVSVEFAHMPPGNYDVDVGMGSAELRLPPDLEVDAKLNSGIGQSRADYPLAGPGAPIHIRMSTGIGRAVLKKASAASARDAGPTPADEGPAKAERGGRTGSHRGEAEEMRVLQLMEQGRITPREAADLIAALKGMPPPYTDDES